MSAPDETLAGQEPAEAIGAFPRRHRVPILRREHGEPADSGKLLIAEHLVCSFGGTVAVSDASFALAEGQITALIGPNGAGKSTVLKLVSGALKPTKGSVYFAGRDVTGWPPYRLARAGLVRTFQIASIFGRLTTLENLLIADPGHRGDSFLGALRGRRHWEPDERECLERAWALLDELALTDKANEYADELSGGQRRLLELARSLMAEPRLLLLDEPTTGVSPPTVAVMIRYLKGLQERGMTILVVEHQFEIARQLAERVIVMVQGNVLTEGDPDAIARDPEVQRAYVLG